MESSSTNEISDFQEASNVSFQNIKEALNFPGNQKLETSNRIILGNEFSSIFETSSIDLKTTTVAVEVRSLDADATPEDIVTAISVRTMDTMTTDNIKTIKPSYEVKTIAVVLPPARVANKLAAGPRLRIGWALCLVRLRIPMNRFFYIYIFYIRCFDFGHRKTTCTGPDRTGLCLNCWSPGHAKFLANCRNKR